jgi:hypothetical protein
VYARVIHGQFLRFDADRGTRRGAGDRLANRIARCSCSALFPDSGQITLTNETVHHRHYTSWCSTAHAGQTVERSAHGPHTKIVISQTKTRLLRGGRPLLLPVLP